MNLKIYIKEVKYKSCKKAYILIMAEKRKWFDLLTHHYRAYNTSNKLKNFFFRPLIFCQLRKQINRI